MGISRGTKKAIWGVFIAVLVPVLVFVIQQWLTKPPPPPIKATAVLQVNGQVLDSASKRLIENVAVHLHVASIQEEQNTDALGRYAFSVETDDPNLSGSIQMEGAGYKAATYNFSAQELSAPQSLYLDANPAAPPPTGGGTAGGPAANAPLVSHPALAQYVARKDPKRFAAILGKR